MTKTVDMDTQIMPIIPQPEGFHQHYHPFARFISTAQDTGDATGNPIVFNSRLNADTSTNVYALISWVSVTSADTDFGGMSFNIHTECWHDYRDKGLDGVSYWFAICHEDALQLDGIRWIALKQYSPPLFLGRTSRRDDGEDGLVEIVCATNTNTKDYKAVIRGLLFKKEPLVSPYWMKPS